MIKTKPLVKQQ